MSFVPRPGRAWLVLALGIISIFSTETFAQDSRPVSEAVERQIADIFTIKKSLSAGEKKLSSRLAFANRQMREPNLKIGDVEARTIIDTSMVDAEGMVLVDIDASVTKDLLKLISAVGGKVESSYPQYRSIRALIPMTMLTKIADNAGVRSIREADKMILNSSSAFREQLTAASGGRSMFPLPFAGSLTSQGYISHKAREVIGLGITGSGVKVGVMSDSASAARVSALIASGDLNANTTVLSAGTGTDEGTAMMEIVQDMAPGAQIYFATANGGQATMAANIAALSAAGCKIIVDDVSYFAEGAFQDGPIAQAVNTFVAGGGLYFSSAANSGNVTSNTSGTWEGDFVDGGTITGPIATAGETGQVHNFAVGQAYISLLSAGGSTQVLSLKWSDPLAGSTNDYDLFLVNSTNTTLKRFSAAVQNGTQDPAELMQGANVAGDRLVVVKFSGAARALRVDGHRMTLSGGTSGSSFGHNAAEKTISVAASFWNSARLGTIAFTGAANGIETFSSDGPRKVFYNPNGTAITPGNILFATNGGVNLAKPDITAADGVSTKTPGFLPFFGTSAAAPHAAGIAALVLAAKPTITNTQARQILLSTSLDNMAAGADRDGGAGIVMALPAVQAAQALP